MKTIKLFLASSIDEFKFERLEFERFIRVLDKIFREHGIQLDLVACEDMPRDLAKISAQTRINEQIPGCDYFYMMIGKEAGDKTVEEFDTALDSMRDSGKPKIYIYFYRFNMEDMDNQSESVRKLVIRLNEDIKHYFGVFLNIDTVKLDFLMELCRDYPSEVGLHFEDGEAVLQNQKVLALKNVPLYGNNAELTKLKNEKQRLDNKFARLCAEYGAHPESSEVYRELVRTSEERTRIYDRFHELEKEVFSLYKEIKSGGADMTWYEREARKQMEQGNYAAAVAILRDVQREKELERAILFADTSLEKIKDHVRENQLLIKTLKTQKRTNENVSEIRRCYKESVDLILKYHLDSKLLYDYAVFLVGTVHDFKETIELTEIMKEKVKNDDLETLVDIYELAGEAYLINAHKLLEGREYYKKAIEMYYQLSDSSKKYTRLVFCLDRVLSTYRISGFESYEAAHQIILELQEMLEKKSFYVSRYDKCLIYRACSLFYRDEGKYESREFAEQYALDALKIAKRDENGLLAICYGILGDFYRDQKRYDDAYEYYVHQYEVNRQEYRNNSYNLEGIANSSKSLSLVLKDMHRYNEAIAYAEEALDKFRALAERNPLSYEFSLTNQLHKLGILYEKVYDFYKAENVYREAYHRRKTTLGRDDVYEYEVIYSCRALACVLANMDRYEEAEVLFREALSISETYAGKNTENERYVRSTKSQLVRNCLTPMGRYDEAEACVQELIDSRREYLKKNSLSIDEDLAAYLEDYAVLLCTMDRAEDAVAPMKEVYSYYVSGEADGKATITETIVLHNLAWVLKEAGHYEEAAPYLDREQKNRERMQRDGEEGLELYLANTYKLRLENCLGIGDVDAGSEYYQKALQGYERLAEICPDAFASNIAELHLDYAKLLIKAGNFEAASGSCRKAIEYFTELEKKASSAYHKNLIDAYETYVTIQKKQIT